MAVPLPLLQDDWNHIRSIIAWPKKAGMGEHYFGEMAVSQQALFSVNQSTPGITALLINFKYVAASEFPNQWLKQHAC